MNTKKTKNYAIDWELILIPLVIIILLCVCFLIFPLQSTRILDALRFFLSEKLGFWYIFLGLATLIFSLYIAFSSYGNIILGKEKKIEHSNFNWGAMIFTSTMAADILFYSFCEWSLYASEDYITSKGGMQLWASTYPIFHWGPIPWSFYMVLAAAFGFMLHVQKRPKQKFSEACRPLIGEQANGFLGKLINLIAAFALLAGTATTFTLATPLLSACISNLFNIPNSILLTIVTLLAIASIYTITIWFGIKGISKLATLCSYLFFMLILYVFIGGGKSFYIIETSISALGNMIQNFIGMATWMDPLRETFFPQNWTIFYWAYWMVWCVATPFFIGSISKGRTIRNVILGGYMYGLAGTFTSFFVFGNYGLGLQMHGRITMAEDIAAGGDISQAILTVLNTLPFSKLSIFLLILCMITFYATTFDALTMVMSTYSYKHLPVGVEPKRVVRIFWAILFILLPISLVFSENSMKSLQSVSIIAAFPISIIIVIILLSFLREAKKMI